MRCSCVPKAEKHSLTRRRVPPDFCFCDSEGEGESSRILGRGKRSRGRLWASCGGWSANKVQRVFAQGNFFRDAQNQIAYFDHPFDVELLPVVRRTVVVFVHPRIEMNRGNVLVNEGGVVAVSSSS